MFDFNYVKKTLQELADYLEDNYVWVTTPVNGMLDFSATHLELCSEGLLLEDEKIPLHEIICDADFEMCGHDFGRQEDFVYIFTTKEKAQEACDQYNKRFGNNENKRRQKEQRAEDKIYGMTDEQLDKFLEE